MYIVLTLSMLQEGRRYLVEAEPDGSSLVVQGLSPTDAGIYTCQVSALTPVLIQHSVAVRTRPAIQVEQAPRLTVVAATARATTLTCAVLAGSPAPRLRWQKKTGENVVFVGEGRRLVFGAVTKEDAGTYICLADNGFSEEPAVSSVELDVLCK